MSDLTASLSGRAGFEDEHVALGESFARFLDDEVAPHADAFHENGLHRNVLAVAAEHGFLGMAVPEDRGGVGVDDPRFSLALGREAGRHGHVGVALVFAAHNDLVTPLLVEHSSASLASRTLGGLADGSLIGALAAPPTRADGMSHPAVNAIRAGDGWRLDGTCEQVVGAVTADLLVVLARTPDGDALFAVPATAEGLAVQRGEGSLGARAAGLADLQLDAVEILDEDLLGTPGNAAAQLSSVDAGWTLSLASISHAAAGRALEITREYVLDRRAFGQPIASFQNTRLALGALGAEFAAAGALLDEVVGSGISASSGDRAALKLTASELLGRVVDAGLQFHGGYGYMLEYPIARMYLDARIVRLLHPTSERCRLLVAEQLGV